MRRPSLGRARRNARQSQIAKANGRRNDSNVELAAKLSTRDKAYLDKYYDLVAAQRKRITRWIPFLVL